MQHAYNPQNDIDTGQSIKCTAFARKTWPKKIGVSGFSFMVRRYPVKAVKTGNWCLTVCQGVQTLSTDIIDVKHSTADTCSPIQVTEINHNVVHATIPEGSRKRARLPAPQANVDKQAGRLVRLGQETRVPQCAPPYPPLLVIQLLSVQLAIERQLAAVPERTFPVVHVHVDSVPSRAQVAS